MANNTTVSTLIVQAEERGMAAAAAKADKLASSVEKAGAAIGATGKTTDTAEKAVLKYQRQIDSLQKSIDPAFRSAAKLEEIQRKVQMAVDSGSVSQERANKIISLASVKYAEAGAAAAEQARSTMAASAAAEALRAELNPLGAAQARLNAQMDEYRGLAARGVISTQELADAEEMLAAKRAKLEGAGGMSRGVSRYGFRPDQSLNLLRQGGDITTMGLMGASVQQIAFSQGAQIAEIFADAEGGAKRSMRAIGQDILGLTRFINPLTVGLTLAGGAFIYFAMQSSAAERSVEKSKIAAEKYRKVLDELKTSSQDVAAAADKIFQRETQVSPEVAQAQLSTAIKSAQEARTAAVEAARTGLSRDLLGSMGGLGDGNRQRQFNAIDGLITSFESGKISAKTFRDELAKLRNDGDLSRRFRESAEGIDEFAKSAVEADAIVESLRRSISEMRRENVEQAMDGLRSFVPDRRGQREQIEDAYRLTLSRIQQMQIKDPRAQEGQISSATQQYKAALEELERVESLRRAGVSLDIATVGRLTAAQQANAAAMRARLNAMSEGLSTTDANRRAEEAYALSIAQTTDAMNQSAIQRQRGMQDTLDGLALEAQTLGKTTSEAARLETQYSLMAAAREAAFGEGRESVTAAEIANINAVADAVGRATGRLDAMRKEQDLLFERSQFYRSELDQQIAEATRGMDAQEAATIDSLMRGNDRLKNLKGDLKEAFGGLGADIRNATSATGLFESALARVQNAVGKQFDKIIDNGVDSLINSMMPQLAGGPSLTAPDIPQLQSVAQMQVAVLNVGAIGGAGASGLLGALPGSVERGGALPPVAMDAASKRVADAWAVTGNSLVDGINQSAQALGIEAKHLATAISYETGGTFDPMKRGPTTQWGQHRGLIQFGEPQARQHGVDFSSSQSALSSQLGADGAIVKYLRGAGVKPGMGMMDIYSAINAGSVGRYGASDANNGGAPGTVADKVNYQMAAHAAKAEALLAKSTQASSALVEANGNIAQAAPQFASGMQQSLNGTILNGVGQIADQFVPGFGGVLTQLLQGMQSAGGGGGGGGGGFGSIIASFFGGGGGDAWAGMRAAGGPVAAGKVYAVGERGVELFAPGVSGSIIPNHALGMVDPGQTTAGMAMAAGRMAGQPSPNITFKSEVINNSSATVREESQDDGNGGRIQRYVIDDAVSRSINSGPKTGKAMRERGAKRPAIR